MTFLEGGRGRVITGGGSCELHNTIPFCPCYAILPRQLRIQYVWFLSHSTEIYLSAVTFRSLLVLLHLLAVLVQLLVGEFVEGVGTLLADDDPGLVFLLNDGLGCGH